MKNQYLIPLLLFIASLQCYLIPSWMVANLPTPNQVVLAKNGESFEVSKLYLESNGICFIITETKKFHCLEYGEVRSLEVENKYNTLLRSQKMFKSFFDANYIVF